MITVVNFLHSLKAQFPIILTDSGMMTPSNDVQPSNAHPLIVLTDDGIVTVTNDVHPLKAKEPMFFIVEGIETCFNLRQFFNAPSFISSCFVNKRLIISELFFSAAILKGLKLNKKILKFH